MVVIIEAMHQKALGYYGEKLAADYLVSKGYQILQKNFTVKGGEIDLIAQKGSITIFIEVKTRTSNTFGSGEESVHFQKRQRLKKAIYRYLEKYRCGNFRVDLVEIELNAQEAHGGDLKNLQHFEDIPL